MLQTMNPYWQNTTETGEIGEISRRTCGEFNVASKQYLKHSEISISFV